jgi:hypothetical protein
VELWKLGHIHRLHIHCTVSTFLIPPVCHHHTAVLLLNMNCLLFSCDFKNRYLTLQQFIECIRPFTA